MQFRSRVVVETIPLTYKPQDKWSFGLVIFSPNHPKLNINTLPSNQDDSDTNRTKNYNILETKTYGYSQGTQQKVYAKMLNAEKARYDDKLHVQFVQFVHGVVSSSEDQPRKSWQDLELRGWGEKEWDGGIYTRVLKRRSGSTKSSV